MAKQVKKKPVAVGKPNDKKQQHLPDKESETGTMDMPRIKAIEDAAEDLVEAKYEIANWEAEKDEARGRLLEYVKKAIDQGKLQQGVTYVAQTTQGPYEITFDLKDALSVKKSKKNDTATEKAK